MATPINPENAMDWDEPLNTDPLFTSKHIFNTADITVTFNGDTVGQIADPTSVFDTTGANGTKTTKDGVTLYPIDSEFGFYVDDFNAATPKELDGDYAEGWAGDLIIGGEQVGLVLSDSPTDTFKTPAVLGTWLAGIGGNTVKASTEHYTVMQNVLSDAKYPGDPDADYALDDNLILLSQNPDWNGLYVADLLADPETYGVVDKNGDGILDIRDLLNPNESTIAYDIAYSTDYSVTMKDDGKLLYRWGNTIKRPNDIRLEAELPLPDEWTEVNPDNLTKLFQITSAELVVHHTITNNPNDQVRPEDFENESAIGTLPTYAIVPDYNEDGNGPREVWVSTADYYAGDGTLYEAGTILRDDWLADQAAASDAAALGLVDASTLAGYTNAWFTTMDREPFEPDLNEDGTDYDTGPRWRLQPDKYGQDLPSVVIPVDPSLPPPPQQDEVKYEVGLETQTVLNMLDWATEISPLSISAGWQNNAGDVSVNGLNLTNNFDVAVYLKGDIKPATIYSAELVMDYEEIPFHAAGAAITGTAGSDYLVGIGNNTFTGLGGADLFVLSYGTSLTNVVTASVITDFEVGLDKLGLIGFDALRGFDAEDPASAALITQAVIDDDVTVSVDGALVATLEGKAAELDTDGDGTIEAGEGLSLLDSFFVSNPMPADTPPVNVIDGTPGDDLLVGTAGMDSISGLAGNDTLYGLQGNDTLLGDADNDLIFGGSDDDLILGSGGLDTLYGDTGADTLDGGDNSDRYFLADALDTLQDTGTVGFDEAFVTLTTGVAIDVSGWSGIERLNGYEGNDTLDASGASTAWVLSGENGDDSLIGGALNDTLLGGAGNDFLSGGDGADQMLGGTGDDTFDGGAGDDTFFIGQSGDVVQDGGTGFDKAQINNAAGVSLSIGTWVGVERVNGFTGNDAIDATGSAASLIMDGRAGDDTLSGGSSGDTFYAGDGNDSVFGGAGNDALIGDTGNDTLSGGDGDDFLLGGGGADVFVFDDDWANDVVKDFTIGEDTLDFTLHSGVASLGDLTIEQAGTDTRITLVTPGLDVLWLANIDAVDLGAGDFQFA
ncbi:calcium-binding protein [Palleronia sp. KMU-117]|uniref:calcium-binding protein n=1 Tax=Palleronia sp. KMU-117 TaxID=3434108 RepID=UPI003D73DAD6